MLRNSGLQLQTKIIEDGSYWSATLDYFNSKVAAVRQTTGSRSANGIWKFQTFLHL